MGIHDLGAAHLGRERSGIEEIIKSGDSTFVIRRDRKRSFEDMAKDRNLDPDEVRPVYEKLLNRLVEERNKQGVLKVKYEEIGKEGDQ